MNRILSLALSFTIAALAMQAHAQVRLSFNGHSVGVGSYDEATQNTIYIMLDGMIGPPHLDGSNSPWYLNMMSKSHATYGYPSLPNTAPFYQCDHDPCALCSYDLTAWLEPGSVIAGHVDQGTDQNAHVHGNEWQGHVPTDFSFLRIEFISHDGGIGLRPGAHNSQLFGLKERSELQCRHGGGIKALYR